MTRPASDEAAPYYFKYIDRVVTDDVMGELERQGEAARSFWRAIPEETSLHRYEPGKWSIREVLAHLNDAERLFAFRAFWFARGFDSALPSYEQEVASAASRADEVPLSAHAEEFDALRRTTVALFRNLPPEAWMRRGVASDYPFTVRALAFIIAGHVEHHLALVRERYLSS